MSPTLKFSAAAVPASSATCFGPSGHWPVLSFSGLNCGWEASLPSPNCGAPPEPSALPSRPKISALLDAIGAIVPPAAATSGSARTLREQRRGNRRRAALGALDDLLAGDHRVGLLVGRREDAVERLLDRVGQDERPADHRDADHDGERRQQRADLAAREALQRDGDHRSVISSSAARISCARRAARGRGRCCRRRGTARGRRSPRRARRG